MHDMTDEKTLSMQDAAVRYTELFNQLTIKQNSTEQLLGVLDQSLKDKGTAPDAAIKIFNDFSAIEDCHKEFGVTDNQTNELDIWQSNESSRKAFEIIEGLLVYLKQEDILNNNEIIDRLENEKLLYAQMHQITTSLISQIENSPDSNQNKNQADEHTQKIPSEDIHTLLDITEINNEKLNVFDIDLSAWQEALDETKQGLSPLDQSSPTENSIEELLEKLEIDTKNGIDSQAIHAVVASDIKNEINSVRQKLEEEYKSILNTLIQGKDIKDYDKTFSNITESQKNISKLFESLKALGEDSVENVSIDNDKHALALQFCKLIQDSIIVNQYNLFKQDSDKVLKSESMTSEERLKLGIAHGNLTNNIQESIVNYGLSDPLNELWASSDKMMSNVNVSYEKITRAQKQKEKVANPKENEDLQILITKADKAIANKDNAAVLEIKGVLQEHQNHLSKSLESAISSAQNVKTLKNEMKVVHELLDKVNKQLGIVPKVQITVSSNDEKIPEINKTSNPTRFTR